MSFPQSGKNQSVHEEVGVSGKWLARLIKGAGGILTAVGLFGLYVLSDDKIGVRNWVARATGLEADMVLVILIGALVLGVVLTFIGGRLERALKQSDWLS